MTALAPRIGFDRFIPLEWATMALNVRAGTAQLGDLEALLAGAALGSAARRKTRTILKRLWLEPRRELIEYADRAVAIVRANPDVPFAALHWGMTVASYPFFGKVSELIGRLIALQGDCSSAEIHRRMSEAYGEREGTYRTTNRVIQSQVGWGAVERVAKGTRVVRLPPIVIEDDALTTWLIEAALCYARRPLSISTLSALPVLFPFILTRPVGYLLSNNANLAVMSEGPSDQIVFFREAVSPRVDSAPSGYGRTRTAL